jgi:hypothetical protein
MGSLICRPRCASPNNAAHCSVTVAGGGAEGATWSAASLTSAMSSMLSVSSSGRPVKVRRAGRNLVDGHNEVVTTDGPRVIGMLGGMSWEPTAQYYWLANELVRERLGGLHSARILLASVDSADIETLQADGR